MQKQAGCGRFGKKEKEVGRRFILNGEEQIQKRSPGLLLPGDRSVYFAFTLFYFYLERYSLPGGCFVIGISSRPDFDFHLIGAFL